MTETVRIVYILTMLVLYEGESSEAGRPGNASAPAQRGKPRPPPDVVEVSSDVASGGERSVPRNQSAEPPGSDSGHAAVLCGPCWREAAPLQLRNPQLRGLSGGQAGCAAWPASSPDKHKPLAVDGP